MGQPESAQGGRRRPVLPGETAPVLRLVGQMPEGLREVALGQRPLTPEEIAAADASEAAAEAAYARELEATRRAGRERVWARCLPYRYRDASLDQLVAQQNPDGRVRQWLDKEGAQNLLMGGPSRHGKTYAAYAIANEARARGWYVAASSAKALSTALRPGDEARAAQAWAEAVGSRLFVLDDMGQEKVTEWVVAEFSALVEERVSTAYVEGGVAYPKKTIFTTNREYDDLIEVYGDPLVERIMESGTAVWIQGEKLSAPTPW